MNIKKFSQMAKARTKIWSKIDWFFFGSIGSTIAYFSASYISNYSSHQIFIEPRIFSSRSSSKVPNTQNSNKNSKNDASTKLKIFFPIRNNSIFQNENSNQKACGCSKSMSSPWNMFIIIFVYLDKKKMDRSTRLRK